MADHTVDYNSAELDKTPYFMDLISFDKPYLAGSRRSRIGRGARDGAVSSGGALDSGTFRIRLSTYAASAAALLARLDALQVLMNIGGEETLVCSLFPGRFWNVETDGIWDLEMLGDRGAELTLQFVSPKPAAYSTSETVKEYVITTDPDTFVVPAVDLENASALVYPEYKILATSGAPSGIILENTTRQEVLTWDSVLTATWWFKVDADLMTIEKANADAWPGTNALAGKSGVYPALTPRIANTIKVTGIETGTMDVTFRERYLT